MNIRTTLILLVLLVLGVVALMLTRAGQDDATTHPTQNTTPETLARDAQPVFSESELRTGLGRIGLYPGQDRPLVLERRGGQHWTTSPLVFPADPRAIDELLSILADLRGEPTDDDAIGPVPDMPLIKLGTVEDPITIRVGNRLGGGRAGIVVDRGGGSTRYIVRDTLRDLFDNFDARLFFAKSINAPPMPATARVELLVDGERSALVQRDGQWWVEHGNGLERALESALPRRPGVRDYFALFAKLEIQSHADPRDAPNRAAFGLDRPLIAVRFEPLATDRDPNPDADAWVMRVGVPADPADQTRYVSYGPADDAAHAVFIVPTQQAIRLGQDATAFRDPRLITTPTALIESITTLTPAGGKQRFDFAAGAGATLTADDAAPTAISPRAAASIVTALYDARAVGYVEQRPVNAEPLMTIQITARLNGPNESFTLYRDPQAAARDTPTVLARRSNEPVLLRVEQSAVASLLDSGFRTAPD
ncbi:MAG: DUF4340 domain-containing protein [Phycisphaeraceae bacterium]